MIKSEPIIIDCDPGQDDALMLFLALNAPELEVKGIVAVAGNVPLAATSLNICMLAQLCGRMDVPLFAGCDRPMQRPLVTAEYVHGKTGIDGFELFQPKVSVQPQQGVDFIISALQQSPDQGLTIVATGPLTNIATAIEKAPDIVKKIKRIVVMGGALFEGGNITPSAEFNVYVDPHAWDVVLKCGRPIIAFGLDVTHKVMTNKARVKAIRAIDNPVAEAAADMLDYFDRYDSAKYGSEGAPLHDPCTIAYLIKPELFTLKHCACDVETQSELTLGHTAVDFWHVTEKVKNIDWAYDVDADGFFNLLNERLARY